MIIKKSQPDKIEYLWNERLFLVCCEILEKEVYSEFAAVDANLKEGMILEMVNGEFKICVIVNKELCHFTPINALEVSLDIYEQQI